MLPLSPVEFIGGPRVGSPTVDHSIDYCHPAGTPVVAEEAAWNRAALTESNPVCLLLHFRRAYSRFSDRTTKPLSKHTTVWLLASPQWDPQHCGEGLRWAYALNMLSSCCFFQERRPSLEILLHVHSYPWISFMMGTGQRTKHSKPQIKKW